MNPEIEIFNVDINEISQTSKENFGESTYRNCYFCEKPFQIDSKDIFSIQNLSKNKVFCTFCLRHNFNYRNNCNVLILSYRGIIGYYYLELYKKRKEIWLNQLKEMIDLHMSVGINNSSFSYDSSTYLWFLDFNKIGKAQKKIDIDHVLATNKKIIQCFNLPKLTTTFSEPDMCDKFEKSIKIFYQQRKRPKDRNILCPTLSGIINRHSCNFEKTRNFTPKKLALL